MTFTDSMLSVLLTHHASRIRRHCARSTPSSILHSPSSPRFQRAFTLIELMVVIVLIGVLTAAILPEMRGTYQDALLRSTSRELINVFSLASSRAVSLNQLHRVRLDERTGRYTLERRVRSTPTGDEFAPVEDVPAGQGKLDTRITITLHRPGEGPTTEAAQPTEAASGEPVAPGEPAAPVEPPPAPSEPSATAQPSAIAFYPDGTTDGGNIELHDADGYRFVLRLNPVTARVHVVELARD